MGARRRYSREYKLEAVQLVTQRGVSVAQAARGQWWPRVAAPGRNGLCRWGQLRRL